MPRTYGWIKDKPDTRDLLLNTKRLPAAQAALPSSYDNTRWCDVVYDQGNEGSCTGNGTAGAVYCDRKRQGLTPWTPSRNFLYYNGRIPEGSTGQDAGASIRDVVKGLNAYGYCAETLWPYVEAKVCTKPNSAAYADAKKRELVVYHSVPQTLSGIKSVLASGLNIIFGFTVYPSFESDAVAASGIATLPTAADLKAGALGGHCCLLVGYSDATKQWKCRNSWGTGWGQKGYFTLPYTYLTNAGLSSDFWVIQSLSA